MQARRQLDLGGPRRNAIDFRSTDACFCSRSDDTYTTMKFVYLRATCTASNVAWRATCWNAASANARSAISSAARWESSSATMN
jgi:hypothetical protein